MKFPFSNPVVAFPKNDLNSLLLIHFSFALTYYQRYISSSLKYSDAFLIIGTSKFDGGRFLKYFYQL